MKKKLVIFLAMLVAALCFSLAQAMDKSTALSQGLGVAVNTPNGETSLEQGWNTVTPAWFYILNSTGSLRFNADNVTYRIDSYGSQMPIATCISKGRTLYLQVNGSYITSAGCLPTGGGGGGGGGSAPSVTTTSASSITATTASSGGNVTSDGGASVTARGVCWNTSGSPTTSDSKTSDGTGTGSFTSSITGLTANTTYYARAYATNSAGTSYGSSVTFKTSAGGSGTTPTVTTTSASSITSTTASSGGNVTSDGGASVTARGVCWNTSGTPTISDSKTSNGTGTGSFTSSITGLTANTTYYARAYATNSAGTAYGSSVTFTTSTGGGGVKVPTVDTRVGGPWGGTEKDPDYTIWNGSYSITDDGGATPSAHGLCWSTHDYPTTSDTCVTGTYTTASYLPEKSYKAVLTGLPFKKGTHTVVYLRAYATNSAGTAYGDVVNMDFNL